MRFLVDANVISEATRRNPDPHVVRWLSDNEADLVVTPIVLGEIEYGILLLPDSKQRRALRRWFAEYVQKFTVVDFDVPTATVWAQLLARLKQNATPMPIKDSLIAASALRHGLTVSTRNTTDFAKSGAKLINPFP